MNFIWFNKPTMYLAALFGISNNMWSFVFFFDHIDYVSFVFILERMNLKRLKHYPSMKYIWLLKLVASLTSLHFFKVNLIRDLFQRHTTPPPPPAWQRERKRKSFLYGNWYGETITILQHKYWFIKWHMPLLKIIVEISIGICKPIIS